MTMGPFRLATTAVLAVPLLLPVPAHAARPLVAEDASVLAPRFCQLETWRQNNEDNKETWGAPHCGLAGNWELIAGIGQMRPPWNHSRGNPRVLRTKTVLRPLAGNRWGVGLVLSDQFNAGESLAGDLSLTIPLSVSLWRDQVLVHANAGWVRRQAGPNGVTWALASEWNVSRLFGLTLEAYGAGHRHSYVQAGARYDLVPRRLTLDAAIGNRFGLRGVERYFAIGLTFTTEVLR
jgi:hypothetical protein